jgi:hypothetical protein
VVNFTGIGALTRIAVVTVVDQGVIWRY